MLRSHQEHRRHPDDRASPTRQCVCRQDPRAYGKTPNQRLVGVGVGVAFGLFVAVLVGVADGAGVLVSVAVGTGVLVGVLVGTGVWVGTAVLVGAGALVEVTVGVGVPGTGTPVDVGVGEAGKLPPVTRGVAVGVTLGPAASGVTVVAASEVNGAMVAVPSRLSCAPAPRVS